MPVGLEMPHYCATKDLKPRPGLEGHVDSRMKFADAGRSVPMSGRYIEHVPWPQVICSMAQGWRVGSAYECVDRGYDAAVQMIDTFVVRVHQHGACIAANSEQLMGGSRGGLTTEIHAAVDTSGLPVRIALTTGEAHDNRLVLTLLSGLN